MEALSSLIGILLHIAYQYMKALFFLLCKDVQNMSNTPLYPLAKPEASQAADASWEYLETGVRHYTIELIQSYRAQCILAVNKNIIHFHPDPSMLNTWIDALLSAIKIAEQELIELHPLHQGRTGPAMNPNDIAQFLAINEKYVHVQSKLIGLWNNYFQPLFNSNQQAHAAATAAEQNKKG
jgi:hypothetical protein